MRRNHTIRREDDDGGTDDNDERQEKEEDVSVLPVVAMIAVAKAATAIAAGEAHHVRGREQCGAARQLRLLRAQQPRTRRLVQRRAGILPP